MFSSSFPLKVIRFDINPNYDNKQIDISEVKSIRPSIAQNPTNKSFALRLKIMYNYINLGNKDEVVGFLAEKVSVLATTTLDKDRPVLLRHLTTLLTEVDAYFQQNFPAIFSLKNVQVNVNEVADGILTLLQTNGFYPHN